MYIISHVYSNHFYIKNININAFPRAHNSELRLDDETVMRFFLPHYIHRFALGLTSHA